MSFAKHICFLSFACLAGFGPAQAASGWDAASWDQASLARCVEAISTAQPFEGDTLRKLETPLVAEAHREHPATSWLAPNGRFFVSMIAFPAGPDSYRHVCDVRSAAYVESEAVIDSFGRFLDWASDEAHAGRLAYQSTRRVRQPGTSLALLHSTSANPNGCTISVSLLARPYEGILSFSATEMASEGCGGAALIGGIVQ